MALVRSIEQQYWSLAQQHAQLFGSEKSVEVAEEVLRREQSELEVGRGTVADVAEAQQRLEQFRLDLVTKTSDVLTTERQLRNILDLPSQDGRRIVPSSAPTEAQLEPDWEACLAQMLLVQPDIAHAQSLVRVAELQVLIARNQLLPQLTLNDLVLLSGLGTELDCTMASLVDAELQAACPHSNRSTGQDFQDWQQGFTFALPPGTRAPLANVRNAQYNLIRQRASLQQIIKQTTHSLARFFLEVDANYELFKTASRLRAAAAQWLEAQRAFYEEGRITIDRYLDAVSQYATALAQEAQFKTTYNISIIALEEAKGTLLDYENIEVQAGPAGPKGVACCDSPTIRSDTAQPTVCSGPDPASGLAVADLCREFRVGIAQGLFPPLDMTGEKRPDPEVHPVAWKTAEVCAEESCTGCSSQTTSDRKRKATMTPQNFTVRIPVNGARVTLQIHADITIYEDKSASEEDDTCCHQR
jgi:outer membrane protein TolC